MRAIGIKSAVMDSLGKMKFFQFCIAMAILFFVMGCSRQKSGETISDKEPVAAVKKNNEGTKFPEKEEPALLLSQAHQEVKMSSEFGKKREISPARLKIIRLTERGWVSEMIEDPDSNAFHKAVGYKLKGESGILTIGANKAMLKFWRKIDGEWVSETLYEKSFGGKWDRFRDIEIGDVTGDGKPEMVLGTHDQGVIVILEEGETGPAPTELEPKPDTFIHEIEIGDIDGDGMNEFFATPSEPNKISLQPQMGTIVMYKWNGKDFVKELIDAPEYTHAKEILAADMEGDGKTALYAAMQAPSPPDENRTKTALIIKKYEYKEGGIVSSVTAKIGAEKRCRFLVPGDVDGDGVKELAASCGLTGLWLLKRTEDGGWSPVLIDRSVTGFVNACMIADLHGDGVADIYVACDRRKSVRRYFWTGKEFDMEVISEIPPGTTTFNLTLAYL